MREKAERERENVCVCVSFGSSQTRIRWFVCTCHCISFEKQERLPQLASKVNDTGSGVFGDLSLGSAVWILRPSGALKRDH